MIHIFVVSASASLTPYLEGNVSVSGHHSVVRTAVEDTEDHTEDAAEEASQKARSAHRGSPVHVVDRDRDHVTVNVAVHHRARLRALVKMLSVDVQCVVMFSFSIFTTLVLFCQWLFSK